MAILGRRLAAVRLPELRLAWVAPPVALLAIGVRIPLALAQHEILPGDSTEFAQLASNLVAGRGFGGVGTASYRTPGYPVFIAYMDLLPGRREDTVVDAQLFLGVLLVLLVLVVAWRLFGKPAAIIASLLLALSPCLPYIEFPLLSEFLFAFLVFSATALLALELTRDADARWLVLVAVGALYGLSALVRPSGELLALVPLVALLTARRGWGRSALRGLVALAAFAAVVAPWVIHNIDVVGSPTLSTVSGDTLFARAFEVDKLPFPTDTAMGEYASEAAAARGQTRMVTAVRAAFQSDGASRLEALRGEQEIAQTAIKRAPGEYAFGTLREMWRLRMNPNQVNVHTDVGPDLAHPPKLTRSVWSFIKPALRVWWVLSLGTVAGLLVLVTGDPRRRRAGLCFVLAWLAVAGATAAGRGALVRYELQLAPIAAVLGSVGITIVVGAVLRAGRRVRSGRPPAAPAG